MSLSSPVAYYLVILALFLLNGFWSRCFMSYSVSYLYVSYSEPKTSVGEERANLSAIVYL